MRSLGIHAAVRTLNTPSALWITLSLALILCLAALIAALLFLRKKNLEVTALRQEARLTGEQLRALNEGYARLRDEETQARILRHDLRHTLRSISALLEHGDTEAALRYIGSTDRRILGTQTPQYCENRVLNAILAYYLEGAMAEGIQVDTRLDIPEDLPVDAAELANVFANAIENAREACRRLPAEQPKCIRVTCVSHPSFVLEIANTYQGKVVFDVWGRPVSQRPGHGLGTRSIQSFVRGCGALLDYQTEDGYFKLRILFRGAPKHT